YEINRNFRNEGISTQHNPEFTMLEFYQAYAEYEELMRLTEELLAYVAQESVGSTQVQFGEHTISLEPPYRRLSMREAAAEAAAKKLGTAIRAIDMRDQASAAAIASKLGIDAAPGTGAGRLTAEIFESLWEDSLIQPTFVYDFPTEVSPLSKQRKDDPDTV